MKRVIKLVCVCLLAFLACVQVKAYTIPESIDGYVLDEAHVLSDEALEYITERNWKMDQHCGGYVEIVTEEFIRGDIADYSYELFNEWQIGGAKHNNGILLVLSTKEDKFWITYGRGYELEYPSGEFQNKIDDIIDIYLVDDFDAGNYERAVLNTFDALYSEMESIYGTPNSSYYEDDDFYYDDYDYDYYNRSDSSLFSIIFALFARLVVMACSSGTILFLIILWAIFRPRRRRRTYFGAPRSHYHHYSGGYHSSGPSYHSSHSSRSFGGSSHSSSRSFGGGHSSSHSSGRSSGGSSRGGGAGRR